LDRFYFLSLLNKIVNTSASEGLLAQLNADKQIPMTSSSLLMPLRIFLLKSCQAKPSAVIKKEQRNFFPISCAKTDNDGFSLGIWRKKHIGYGYWLSQAPTYTRLENSYCTLTNPCGEKLLCPSILFN
jgi:hypothetical protein